MGKAIATLGIWLEPTLAIWASGEPIIAWAFVVSAWATVVIYEER